MKTTVYAGLGCCLTRQAQRTISPKESKPRLPALRKRPLKAERLEMHAEEMRARPEAVRSRKIRQASLAYWRRRAAAGDACGSK